MASIRLTNWRRESIAREILKYSFESKEKAIADREVDLFHETLRVIFDKDTLRKAAAMPDFWLSKQNYLTLNVGGWCVHLSLERSDGVKLPAHTPSGGSLREAIGLSDETLCEKLRTWAKEKESVKEARRTLGRAIDGFLAKCTTLAKFYELMPDAEIMCRGLTFAVESPSALVVSGQQILCMVAAARSEDRVGCVDGKLVTADA